MDEKETSYKGIIKPVPHFKIHLNIDRLQEGSYILYLTYNNKTIKKVRFKK